jgi:uncharacterized membrane-anchored protein
MTVMKRFLLPVAGLVMAANLGTAEAVDHLLPDPVPTATAKPALKLGSKAAADIEALSGDLEKSIQKGPRDLPLAGQAVLALPEGLIFIPQPQAGKVLAAMGHGERSTLQGLIVPDEGSEQKFGVSLDYSDDGYIDDEAAKTWDADELLENLKRGTEAMNAERQRRGIYAIEVKRWIEPPHYNEAEHRLIWSALVQPKGTETGGSVNYNTYALGRRGHFSLNLISSAETIEANKPVALRLLQALKFEKGHAYEDFDRTTDRVASYGIAALIGGIAAKKLGLISVLVALLAKFGKVIAAGLGVLAVKSRKRRGTVSA